jgi:predicted amino acid dehydrogenase
VHVTSGNTFTAVVGTRRVLEACQRIGIDPQDPESCLAVIGATGNIGSSLARRALRGPAPFSRILLLGRDGQRLERSRRRLRDLFPGSDVESSTDLSDLRGCNVVAVAINTGEPLIYRRHLAEDRPVLIADVSIPSAVSREVHGLPHVQVIPLAATVAIPGEPSFILSSHTSPGLAFCCAAEAILMGLEPEATRELPLTGPIDDRSMEVLEQLGQRHGFFAEYGEGGFRTR